MRRTPVSAGVAALCLLWLSGAATIGAQNSQPGSLLTPAIVEDLQRSWDIQAQLAKIEKDKGAFVDQLIGSWAPFVDNATYDLSDDLRTVAMAAPPWQLYGASLAGDFQTMMQVLRGKVGAGEFVNTLHRPQPKAWAGASADLLGDNAAGLVFTPIAPCRMVDTRNAGARTGIVNPGAPRVFDLTTSGFAEGQGGATSCAGLPSFSHAAWSVNVTVAAYTGNGGAKVFASNGTEPNASFINYFTSAYAIANNGAVPGCYSCADDITVTTFGVPSHVIIDVMGYYERATATQAATSRVAGTPLPLANGAQNWVYGGNCPAGTVLIGGEVVQDFQGMYVQNTMEDGASSWAFWVINGSGSAANAFAWSRCLDRPVRITP